MCTWLSGMIMLDGSLAEICEGVDSHAELIARIAERDHLPPSEVERYWERFEAIPYDVYVRDGGDFAIYIGMYAYAPGELEKPIRRAVTEYLERIRVQQGRYQCRDIILADIEGLIMSTRCRVFGGIVEDASMELSSLRCATYARRTLVASYSAIHAEIVAGGVDMRRSTVESSAIFAPTGRIVLRDCIVREAVIVGEEIAVYRSHIDMSTLCARSITGSQCCVRESDVGAHDVSWNDSDVQARRVDNKPQDYEWRITSFLSEMKVGR